MSDFAMGYQSAMSANDTTQGRAIIDTGVSLSLLADHDDGWLILSDYAHHHIDRDRKGVALQHCRVAGDQGRNLLYSLQHHISQHVQLVHHHRFPEIRCAR